MKKPNTSQREEKRPHRVEATLHIVIPERFVGSGGAKSVDKLNAITSLSRALAWPFIILLLFVVLYEPIIKTAYMVPDVLAESTKLSVGGLSLELERSAKAIGSP